MRAETPVLHIDDTASVAIWGSWGLGVWVCAPELQKRFHLSPLHHPQIVLVVSDKPVRGAERSIPVLGRPTRHPYVEVASKLFEWLEAEGFKVNIDGFSPPLWWWVEIVQEPER